MTVCLVSMHEIRVDHAVDDRHSLRVRSPGGGLIAGFDRFENLFDAGTQQGTSAGIVQPVFLSLARALASLSSIGQGVLRSS